MSSKTLRARLDALAAAVPEEGRAVGFDEAPLAEVVRYMRADLATALKVIEAAKALRSPMTPVGPQGQGGDGEIQCGACHMRSYRGDHHEWCPVLRLRRALEAFEALP